MLDRPLSLFAFAMLCVFIGILVFELQRLDVGALAAITLALAGWDMLGRKKG